MVDVVLLPRDLGQVRSVDETIDRFKRLNGCEGVKETKSLDEVGRDKTAAMIIDYECTGAPLRQIEIQGGGHTWPGARTNIVADWLLGVDRLRLWYEPAAREAASACLGRGPEGRRRTPGRSAVWHCVDQPGANERRALLLRNPGAGQESV